MRYENEPYEDELDRMKARSRRRNTPPSRRRSVSEKQDVKFETTAEQRTVRRTSAGHPRSDKRRKRRKHKGVLKLFFLIAAILTGVLLFRNFRHGGYWTVAIFGVDSRDGNVERGALSDVIMVASINRKTGEIRLVSVFRDSYVRIDSGNDYDKINEAYSGGGYQQAVDTLKNNFDLPIDDYATFNWKAVADAINALGGVDIEITDKEFAYINSFITETVNSTGVGSVHLERPGVNHLDGVQAVAYARLRLMDTDFNRTERQRKVLGQAMEKAKHADFLTLKNLASAIYPQISTSIGLDDVISMAKNARKYHIVQTSGFPFSHREMKIKKKDYVIPTTLESNVVQLHSFLYATEQYVPSDTVQTISRRIAEATGLGKPGKDTETGRQPSAGNTSVPPENTSAQSQPTAVDTETLQESESPSETESLSESETVPEETVEPLEPEPTTGNSNVIEHPGAELNPEGENQPGPGTNRTETNIQDEETQANSFLEAPGQNHNNHTEEQGPGV